MSFQTSTDNIFVIFYFFSEFVIFYYKIYFHLFILYYGWVNDFACIWRLEESLQQFWVRGRTSSLPESSLIC